MDLRAAIAALRVKDRGWEILACRVGFSEPFTLEELAILEDVTRQRVQQIQSTATKQIAKNLISLGPVLDLLEKVCSDLWEPFDSSMSSDVAVSSVRQVLESNGWHNAEAADVERLFLSIRAIGAAQYVPKGNWWPNFFLAVCSLYPPISRFQPVAAELTRKQQEESERSRTWTYQELIDAVLREAKRPLHWSEIVPAAEEMGHRPSFSPTTLYNVILAAPNKYVRVAAGTYGLAEWGLSNLGNYVDIIANVMKSEGRALGYDQIRSRVNLVREIKESSLSMFLYMAPRFYSSIEGTFGLRAWLPPREKQTLRTPKWQVEDPDSFLRVDRAKARGYDIERIVGEDK